MKKLIIVALLSVVLVSPAVGSAQSIDAIKEQIQKLLAQVSALQEQLRALQKTSTTDTDSTESDSQYGNPFSKHRVCGVLLRNLSEGSEGDDVRELQGFLKQEGYFSTKATGYFGPITARAVASWQSAQGVSPIGAFGPQSRERLRIWCGDGSGNAHLQASPTRGEAPLTVTFHTRLSGFRPNTIQYTLDFGDGTSERAADCPAPADACTGPGTNTHTYTQNGTYVATLSKVSDPCLDDGDPNTPRCLAPIHSEVIGKVEIKVGTVACTLEYNPVCGQPPFDCSTGQVCTQVMPAPKTYSNQCFMEADDARFLYAGECRTDTNRTEAPKNCKSWYDGCNSCGRSTPGGPLACTLRYCFQQDKPRCEQYFDDSGNKSPIIHGLSGPTTLAVNEKGEWTVSASDPENGALEYRITWGDEYKLHDVISALNRPESDFVQTPTFTHTYTSAGVYKVSVFVRDAEGKQAHLSTSVKIGGGTSVGCTLEYNPVCGQPPFDCSTGQVCTQVMPAPKTYSNQCFMDAAGAKLLYKGVCKGTSQGCVSGNILHPEGTKRKCIENADGTTSCGAHAKYVCRSGSWNIEDTLPVPVNSPTQGTGSIVPVL